MTYTFAVSVPVEPIFHETIENSSTGLLPAGKYGPVNVERDGSVALFGWELKADSPSAARQRAFDWVEDILKVLAASNDAYRIRASGITVEIIGASASESSPNTLFLEGHLATTKLKGSLKREVAVVDGRASWPEHLNDALDLNYLAVISERPTTRWLLSAIALERLAEGRLGPRPRLLKSRLTRAQLESATDALREVLESIGLQPRDVTRLVGRITETEDRSAAEQIGAYLGLMNVTFAPDDPLAWWRTRGSFAHGQLSAEDSSALSRLVSTTQLALRAELDAVSRIQGA